MATFPRGHNARTILGRRVQVVGEEQRKEPKLGWTLTASDGLTLRGIPAIGRGVAGHIAGTNPARVV